MSVSRSQLPRRPAPLSHRLGQHLLLPVDASSLAAFRIAFGLIMAFGAVRFVSKGWVETVFYAPRFFFKYPGFAWVEPWPAPFMEMHYWAIAILALMVALGLFYRFAVVGFGLMFAYAQLIDLSNYLNHYYLACLLAFLMAFLPMHRVASVDAFIAKKRGRAPVAQTVPAWCLYLLRFQFAVVYFYAGLAKLQGDWLLHGQPLGIWMGARDELAVIGPWLTQSWVVLGMSWFAFFYDATVPFFLMWRKSRPLAFAAVLVFHFFTWVFFEIGLFPFIMTAGATLFFEPDWPRRFHRRGLKASTSPLQAPAWGHGTYPAGTLLVLYCALQVAVPLRHYVYDGDVLWNERGMRYAWKVLVREKNGSLRYFVRDPERDHTWEVSPHQYLDWRQVSEMSGQPDMIVELARYIESEFKKRGVADPEVRVRALVSLNGRPSSLLINPDVDLTRIDSRDAEAYILAAPTSAPLPLAGGGTPDHKHFSRPSESTSL